MLKSAGLVGAVVYYDGMHNDAQMNLALILTAIKHGAVVTNYTEVELAQRCGGQAGRRNGQEHYNRIGVPRPRKGDHQRHGAVHRRAPVSRQPLA